MNTLDTTKLVSEAAQQSDRWLFIAALFVMGVVIYSVARYFVRQNTEDRAEHKADRADWVKRQMVHEETLKSLVQDGHKTMQELAVVLKTNTDALRECNQQLHFPLTGGASRNQNHEP
jgi:hypothetical protein